MLVIHLKSKSEASYKIGMCIGWETFFFLEDFSFGSKYRGLIRFSASAPMQRMQAADEVIIPSSVLEEARMYLRGSQVLLGKQCYVLGNK